MLKVDLIGLSKFGQEIMEDSNKMLSNSIKNKLLTSVLGIEQSWQGTDAIKSLTLLKEEKIKNL